MGGQSIRPASPPSPRQVAFNPTITTRRPPQADELYVMDAFANHASHCPQCRHPFRSHMEGRALCDRGNARARDVAQYIYSKAGQGFSVVDRERRGESVQVEIPAGEDMDAVRGLLKALARGLELRQRSEKRANIISEDRQHFVQARTEPRRDGEERTERRHDPRLVEIRPASARNERRERERYERDGRKEERPSRYVESRGSLYKRDELDRKARQQEQLDPVIIIAEPGRSKGRGYKR